MRRKFSQISYLRNLPDKIFNDLLLSLQLKIYKTDEYLYKRGDISNKIYVVISGQIEIFVNLRDKSLQKLLKRDKNDIFSAISRLEDTGSGNINLPICLLNHGDILNPESAIVNSELPLSCRASDTARVIELDSAIIHKIAESYYPLRDKVKKCSESMFVFDNFRQERLQKNKPLDVLKFDMRVTSLIKFKNEVIKLVLKTQKRNNAEIPNMRIMLLKLKAILGAEQKGLDEMAKKIGIGEIPIDSLNLLEILQLSEFENPLLTQFASKTKEALIVFQFMCDQFKAIESQIEKFDIDFEQLQMKIIDVHSLLDEAISLTPKI